ALLGLVFVEVVSPLPAVALVGAHQVGDPVHLIGGDAVGHADAQHILIGLGVVGLVPLVQVHGGDRVVLKATGVDAGEGAGGEVQHGDGVGLLQGHVGLGAGHGDVLRLQVGGGVGALLQDDVVGGELGALGI